MARFPLLIKSEPHDKNSSSVFTDANWEGKKYSQHHRDYPKQTKTETAAVWLSILEKAYSEHATWNSFLISNGGVQCQTWKGISCYCEINVYFWVEVFLIRSWLKPSPSLRKLFKFCFHMTGNWKWFHSFFPSSFLIHETHLNCKTLFIVDYLDLSLSCHHQPSRC